MSAKRVPTRLVVVGASLALLPLFCLFPGSRKGFMRPRAIAGLPVGELSWSRNGFSGGDINTFWVDLPPVDLGSRLSASMPSSGKWKSYGGGKDVGRFLPDPAKPNGLPLCMIETMPGRVLPGGKHVSSKGATIAVFYSDRLSQWERWKLWLFDPAF